MCTAPGECSQLPAMGLEDGGEVAAAELRAEVESKINCNSLSMSSSDKPSIDSRIPK